jgi:acyl-CoA synthetase (AMP-forming)/AMP-acid ligase II
VNRFDRLPHIAARYAARAERYRATGEWPDRTLGAALRAAVARDPGQRWVFCAADRSETATTLAELAERAEAFARALVAAGATGDSVVGILVPNSAGAVTAFHGAQLAGAVAFPISIREGEESLRHLLDTVGVAHVVVAEGDARRAEWVRRAGAIVWPVSPDGTVATPASSADLPRVEDGVHVISYTSGSTSTPKIVAHTDAQLLAESAGLEQVFEAWGTILVPSPVGHITGILHLLTLPLLRPGDVVSMERWDAEHAVDLCRRHGAEATAGTSLYFHAMSRIAEDLGGLRGGMAGGGPVTPALVRRLDAQGIRVVRAYGSTEHPTISQSLAADPVEGRADTDGRLCPGVEIRLDPDTGEILSRGPDSMAGYLDPELDAASHVGEWLRTGDVGRIDADGRLTIADRVKDLVIRGGENISAKEVEDVLGEWREIVEVAVVGVPDPAYGERACAFVTAARPIDLDDVRGYLAGTRLEKFKWPEHLVLLDEFPRTASGKVRKQSLRETWSAQVSKASP